MIFNKEYNIWHKNKYFVLPLGLGRWAVLTGVLKLHT